MKISPDFIAYKYEDTNVFAARAAIRRGVPIAVWTIRNNADYQNAINEGFVPIFEQFDPGVKRDGSL